jgi:hypothetical protein
MSHDDDRLSGLAAIGMAAARQREPVPAAHQAPPTLLLAVGELECYDGASLWHRDTAETVGTPTGPITRVRREDVHDWFDPHDYEPLQPSKIPVRHRHDRASRVGRVVHLEWGQGSPARILAVLEVDEAEADLWAGRDVFISPGTKRNERGRLVLDHVGLVQSTARIGAAAVRWTGTTFDRRHVWTRQTVPGFDLLTRAADARHKRPQDADAGIPIVGHPGFDERLEEQRHAGPPASDYMSRNGEGGLFYSGGGGRILDVQW